MAAKRIFQIAKEFERDEKDIIAFLTGQGIKVGNRLSAVSEEAYEMLKTKFLAPPEPEPVPEPEPAPEPEPTPEPDATPAPQGEQPPAQGGGKKKKKKNKPAQPDAEQADTPINASNVQNIEVETANVKVSSQVAYEAMMAGNQFIENYNVGKSKKKIKASKPNLTPTSDPWAIICEHKVEYPDSTPMRYWQAVDKLATKSLKLLRAFGMDNRKDLSELREVVSSIGLPFQPREIFTDEENQLFEEQRELLFRTFGHGMGKVNDHLYELKRYAWDMRAQYDYMDFVEYTTTPNHALKYKERAPFAEMLDAVTFSLRGVARRFYFYRKHTERVTAVAPNFLEWIDGYAKLKEQGADAAKLEKYLYWEKKFVDLMVFAACDNLLDPNKKIGTPYDVILALLKNYRDNMDDPDAERNFKYKVRGVTNVIYKTKEYVFVYRFADLEPHKDYRPPEEIAAAEAKAAEEAAEEAAKAAENKESPADSET